MKKIFLTVLCLMLACSAAMADTLTLPESLTVIGEKAFYGDTTLTEVVIPEGVTSVGSEAFSGCEKMTSIMIPNSVKSIGSKAFAGSSLKEITYPTTAEVATDAFDGVAGKRFVFSNDETTKIIWRDETLTFGTYPQTTEGTDNTPIEWLVLDVTEDGKQALLISKYGLDAKQYNNNTSFADVTWETCSLRTWLNKDFLNAAFTSPEQASILEKTVDNSQNQCYDWTTVGAPSNPTGGNDTQDKIFLLSYKQANDYFGALGDSNTKIRVRPTAYAIKQGASTNSSYTVDSSVYGSTDASGTWWLRSPGLSQFSAAYVYFEGSLSLNLDMNYSGECVRPAMWVNLNAIP